MLVLVLFFTWVALKQALRNDQLIEQGREDEILKEMQRERGRHAPLLRLAMPFTIVAENCTGCTACEKRCPTRAISGDPKKAFFIEADALHRLRRVRRDLPRRGDPRHLGQRHQGAEAPGAADRDRPSGQLQRLRRVHRRLPVRLHLAVARERAPTTSAGSRSNEKTCVGCKLCEEVCGWEGIYIMPGQEKAAFLQALGYDADDTAA